MAATKRCTGFPMHPAYCLRMKEKNIFRIQRSRKTSDTSSLVFVSKNLLLLV